MQKAKPNYFKDRSIYYSTFPIRSQAEKGGWNLELKSVYTVGILDFVFDEDKGSNQVFHHEVQLFDKSVQEVFCDKLTYIYLGMPKFTKTVNELETHFDKWLYVLKNLESMTDRPVKLQDSVFNRVFEQAEIANFDDFEEFNRYSERRGQKRRWKKEKITIAGKLKRQNIPPGITSQSTGLTIKEIERL